MSRFSSEPCGARLMFLALESSLGTRTTRVGWCVRSCHLSPTWVLTTVEQSIVPELAYEDFVERVRVKFNSPSDLPMKCVLSRARVAFRDRDFVSQIPRLRWRVRHPPRRRRLGECVLCGLFDAKCSLISCQFLLGAMDEAREASKGRAEGKLEIWVS